MITHGKLLKKPQVAKSLIGMSLVEFDKFYAEFEKAHEECLQASTTTRVSKKKRLRANRREDRREVRRRARVVSIFPNQSSCLRLVSAVLNEISEEWLTGRTYLTFEGST
jgi:transposase-like protein